MLGVFRLKINANGRLTVKRGSRIVLDAQHENVERVQVMGDYPAARWSFLRWFHDFKPRLEFVHISLPAKQATLRRSDGGFEGALQWLTRGGWNMRAAEEAAVRTPLVRVEVKKSV